MVTGIMITTRVFYAYRGCAFIFVTSVMSPRTLTNVFLLLYLSIQIYIPLSYYAWWNEDHTNEMYCWRMFSSVSMSGKKLEFRWIHPDAHESYEGLLLDTSQYFSRPWVVALERGPKWIIAEACSYLCGRMEKMTKREGGRIRYDWYFYPWEGKRNNYVITEVILCEDVTLVSDD